MDLHDCYERAAAAIRDADALLIGAGAGMGVDSSLPDFRGNDGFWKAYPPFRGMSFASVSNPKWFLSDPTQAWGFFGHRLHLYRDAIPHDGFAILKRWGESKPRGYFVFTSNIDGQFQKAGYPGDRIIECHGSIHFLQCVNLCSRAIWPADAINVVVDNVTIRATSELPRCPDCNAFARPNVLMFGDWGWIEDRSEEQHQRYRAWLQEMRGSKLVAIEIGAGTAVPSVRIECERNGTTLIRVNPREPDVDAGHIPVAAGALEALRAIDQVQ